MAPTVLVVDDDPDTREAVEQLLACEGYAVALAGDGEQALRLLEQGLEPCLMLLDLTMPHVNGWELMSEVRRRKLLEGVPIVVATASSSAHPPEGVAAVFRKPYSIEALLLVLRMHCKVPAPRASVSVH